MEYAPVFCGTNLLSLDELQVSGEEDSNTEMMLLSHNICSDNDDSEVVIEDNSDHSVHHQNLTIIWRILAADRDTLTGLLPLSIKLVTDLDRAIAQTLSIAKQ